MKKINLSQLKQWMKLAAVMIPLALPLKQAFSQSLSVAKPSNTLETIVQQYDARYAFLLWDQIDESYNDGNLHYVVEVWPTADTTGTPMISDTVAHIPYAVENGSSLLFFDDLNLGDHRYFTVYAYNNAGHSPRSDLLDVVFLQKHGVLYPGDIDTVNSPYAVNIFDLAKVALGFGASLDQQHPGYYDFKHENPQWGDVPFYRFTDADIMPQSAGKIAGDFKVDLFDLQEVANHLGMVYTSQQQAMKKPQAGSFSKTTWQDDPFLQFLYDANSHELIIKAKQPFLLYGLEFLAQESITPHFSLSFDHIVSKQEAKQWYGTSLGNKTQTVVDTLARIQFSQEPKGLFYTLVTLNHDSLKTLTTGTWYADPLAINDEQSPHQFKVFGNYPNPFNATTTLAFYLSKPSPVVLTFFNNLGQKIYEVTLPKRSEGYHAYRLPEGIFPATGVYFYHLSAENKNYSGKLFYLK